MGRELHDTYGVFADAFDTVCAELDRHLDQPLRRVVFGADADLLNRTRYTQPALFALEVALYRLLESLGVRPTHLLGHSVGELAAAHVAGVFDLPDAARLVTARAALMQSLPPGGAMLTVHAPETAIAPLLAGLQDRVGIAAANGPTSTVVSGDADTIERLADELAGRGHRTNRLRVSHAFHSPLVEPILDELRAVAAAVTYHLPAIPIISTLDPTLTGKDLATADYWIRQARHAVRYADAVTTLHHNHQPATYLELGPDHTLTALTQHNLPTADPHPLLRANQPEPHSLLTALAHLHTTNTPVNFAPLYPPETQPVDLPTYPFQRKRFWLAPTAAQTSPPDSLRYRVVWRPVPDDGAAPVLSGSWLIVAPKAGGAGVTAAAVRAVRGHGGCPVLIEVDVAGTDRDALADLLRRELPQDPPIAGVVSLLGLDERRHERDAAVPTGLAGTLLLVQAMADGGWTVPLWLLTRGAVAVGPGEAPTCPALAQVWGLGRTAALEYPDLWGGLVDLPAELDERAWNRLLAILAAPGDEDQLAVRPAGVFVRRLTRVPAGPPAPRTWAARGTVLVTGGTGALGPLVGRWLAERGARHIVLTGRRGMRAPGAAELRSELAALGVRVTVAACDVADRAALSRLLDRLRSGGSPVRSVVHAAASIRLAPLAETTFAELAEVVAAKAQGALLLDELLADEPLDAFVLFSSIAGIWGAAEHGGYAAANALLDALAERRRAQGRTATSIAWGGWGGDRLPGGEDPRRLARQGLGLLDPDAALRNLRYALDADETSLVVADVDWRRFAPVFATARARPLLAEVARTAATRDGAEEPAANGAGPAAEPPDGPAALARLLAGRSDADRQAALLDLVVEHTAAVLGYPSAQAMPTGRAFRELGLDSLAALGLRNSLSAATGLSLPPTLVFNHPSPEAVARHLDDELGHRATGLAAEVDRLAAALGATGLDDPARADATARLRALLSRLTAGAQTAGADPAPGPGGGAGPGRRPGDEIDLDGVTDEEMFTLIDREVSGEPGGG